MIPFYPNYLNSSWSKLLFCILIFIIIGCSLDKKVSGTVDETDTGIVAMLYNPDGTPAIGTNVKIFKVSDTTKTPILEVISDEKGNYSLSGLSMGTYNIYAENGSLVAFQDSVKVLEDTVLIKDDTLETPINLSGIVGLQPNHDPRTVTVQVLGTDIYSNINESGYFTLNRMAKGNFTLKLSTTLDNYTATYERITISKDTRDTLPDTLWLIYTGIPVVEGLKTSYDTISGVVTLLWNATKYRNFQDYLIYRDYFDSLNMSSKPIAFTTDTVFRDSIFDIANSIGKFSFSDINDYHFKYRVVVRNNSQQEGLSYKYIGIVAASPQKVKTVIEHQTHHIEKGFITDSASINDTLNFTFNITNPTRILKTVKCTDLQDDSVLYIISVDSTNCFKDSLYLKWSNIGIQKLEIAVEDNGSAIWKDTVLFQVVMDEPMVHITTSKITFNAPTKIKADVTDKYGSITKCEWKIGQNSNFVQGLPILPETSITIKDTLIPFISAIIRVTDDDGNVAVDSIDLPINIEWSKINTPSNLRSILDAVAFNGSIYLFSAGDVAIWKSNDGINWQTVALSSPWQRRGGINSVSTVEIFNNRMCVLEIPNPDDTTMLPILWQSTDGIIWDSVQTALPIYDCTKINGFLFVAHNGNLYAGKGNTFISHYDRPLYKTADGVNWKVTKSADDKEIELPLLLSGSYQITKFDSMLYIGTINSYPFNPSINIWQTKDWEQLNLIKTFELSTYGAFSINIFLENLCLFNRFTGYMLFSRDGINWNQCSILPDVPKPGLYTSLVFNKSIFLMFSDEIWVSK